MNKLLKMYSVFLIALLFTSCQNKKTIPTNPDKMQLQIDTFPMNCSIRAIAALDENTLWFGGSKGQFGYTEDAGKTWFLDSIQAPKNPDLQFRGIAITSEAVFLLGIGSPALLFRSTDKGQNWTTVYQEDHEAAFYDAIAFWDKQNGIAMGDPTDGCLSIILTQDGGKNWSKIPCTQLPSAAEGEAAFAASNSNIALSGNHAWVVSGGAKARVFHSPDRGKNWEVFDTPIVQGGKMTGIFTADFYDAQNGIIFGGDWEKQEQNTQNKAITSDGGKTWTLIADGEQPGYRSSVRYVPGTKGQEIFAVGIPGISCSNNGGKNWEQRSDNSFYTIRMCASGKTAWLAGADKIARMTW